MSWIKNIIILIRLIKRFRDTVLPNLEKFEQKIASLDEDVDKLWDAVSILANKNNDLKHAFVEIKGFQNGLEKTLAIQNQLIQILLAQLKGKDNGR